MQKFRNGELTSYGDCKIFEVISSTIPQATLCPIAFLLAASIYQGNTNRKHKPGISYQMRLLEIKKTLINKKRKFKTVESQMF